MTFRTIPATVTPSAEDIEALARARLQLADELDRHKYRERRIVSGVASPQTIDCVLRNRHLSRVLAGPVALGPRTSRGAVSLLLLVVINTAICVTLAISDGLARRGGCAEIARHYIEAPAGSMREARYARAMSQESCYTEDGRP